MELGRIPYFVCCSRKSANIAARSHCYISDGTVWGGSFIEGLRTDSLYLWGTGIRVSQVVALICVIIGLGGFFLNRKMPFLKDAAQNSKHKEETA